MNPASEHLEGKLLDYAYGELSNGEAKTVEAHLRACPHCTESLTAMKQVRRAMSQLPIAPAPQAGLESLMAFAQKTAEAARARPARGRRWLRWIAPLASVAALSLVLVVSSKVMRRQETTIVLGGNGARGDWEGPLQVKAAKKADLPANAEKALAKETKAGPRQQEARGEEAEAPTTAQAPSQWATPPKDWKGAAPPAPEPVAPSPERSAQQLDDARRGESNGARKGKVAALKAEPKSPPAAAAYDRASRGNTRDEKLQAGAEDHLAREGGPTQGSLPGGVVGGVLGGTPAGRAGDNAAKKQLSAEDASKSSRADMRRTLAGAEGGEPPPAQQVPAEVASSHAGARLESKPAPSASGARSAAPSSLAESAADREREVARLQKALASGAQGQERARLLRRLCELLDALGRTRDADSACDTVVREFPASEEAKSALDRLKVRAAEPRR